jgi:hypothetical protein
MKTNCDEWHLILNSFFPIENLIAEEGFYLFFFKTNQQHKPNELPINIVVYATTSQILAIKSDGLSAIKKIRRDYHRILQQLNILKKKENYTIW